MVNIFHNASQPQTRNQAPKAWQRHRIYLATKLQQQALCREF
jgi:hypothetical protein